MLRLRTRSTCARKLIDRRIGGLEHELAAYSELVAILLILTCKQVRANPVTLLRLGRDAERRFVANWRSDCGFQCKVVEVTNARARVAVHVSTNLRPAGDEINRAAGGVTAVQRVLRSAQYFDALEVVGLQYIHNR